jgi:DNA-cytosine methyltransferase
MSKEIVKAIFDENIAGAREDLTFDAYFDSIKDNEEYKKGLFENYVSDGTKSYDEFNAETFGMGKPEAPSEIGGAESSPTESVSSEFEVGPPAGGTPPGAEPVGAPVGDAIEPIEFGEGPNKEAPVLTRESLLDEFTIEDDMPKQTFWEKVVGFFTGDNVRPERVFVSQEHYDSLKARQDEELKRAEKEAAETGESLDIVDVIQDFVTVTPEEYVAFAGAIQRGLLEAGIAEKVKIGEIPTRADIIEIARIKKEQGQIPSSKNYEKFNDEKTSFLEALEIFAKDPLEIGGQIVLESGAALARYGWDRALLGGGLGAAGGSVVPGIGTAAGGGMGLVAGMGVSGFSLGHASDILSSFQDAGVDLTDKYSLESAFSNKETIAKARDFALKRNVPILLFDLFSGGIAGRIVKAPAKSVIGKVAKETAELGVQSGLAGAGEAAGQITAGQKFDPKSILSEMIGEVTTGVPEIAIGRAIDTKPSAHVAVGQMVEEKKAGKSVKAQAIKIDAPADVVKVMVDVSVGTGEIDAVQAGQIVQEYEQVQEVKKTIPEEFRNNEEIYSAIEEKKKLEEDKKTLDPVFTKGVDEKIAALDAKIEGIVSGREVVAADSVVAAEEVISPETGGAPKVEIIAKRRQKLNRDRTKLVPTGGFDYFAKVGDREVKLSDAEYKAYKDSGVLPESVSAVEATPKVEGEAVTPEAVAPEVSALRDVEGAAKDDKGVLVNEGKWYHGTPIEGISGDELKPNKNGLIFFTRDRGIAERYATNDFNGNTPSSNVFERKLDVNNIFDPKKNSNNYEIIDLLARKGNFENAGRNADFDALAEEALENGEWSVLETKEFIDELKKLGYDAIYIDNRPYYSESAEGKRTFTRDIAVFDTKQHKTVESTQSKEQEVEVQPTQTPEVAEGQPAEVISPEVAEVLSTEDTTRIALESLEVLPEGIESAEEGARIYHEAIGKEERTEAEDAVVMAVEDAVIGGAVVAEETPIDYEVASSNVEETTKALGTKSAEKLNSVKEKISQAETRKFEDDERKQATTRTDRGVQEVQPTGGQQGARDVSGQDRALDIVTTEEEFKRNSPNNGEQRALRRDGKPVIGILYTGHVVPFDKFSRNFRGTGIGNQGGGVFFTLSFDSANKLAKNKAKKGAYSASQSGYAFQTEGAAPYVSEVKISGDNFVFFEEAIPTDVVKQVGVINGVNPANYEKWSEFYLDLYRSFLTEEEIKNGSITDAQTKASDALRKKGITGHVDSFGEVVVYSEKDIVKTRQARIYESDAELISDQYHKAKADGSNPELVKAVDELLGKPAETPKAAEAVTPEDVSTEGVTPEVPGVVEAAEGQRQPSRVATFFSGAGTMEASLPNAQSVMAVEFNPAYVEAYNKAFGVEYEAKDVRDINPEEVIASKPDIFHASPVCKNFSAAKNKRTVLKSDMESADAVARVIREAQPPIVTIENVPDYQGTVPFETIVKALEDAGYTFDVGVYNSADFGGVQNRERLLIRAVKSGELPPIQEKTAPGDWYSAIEDLIESAPDSKFESRSESENWEMTRIKDMVRKGKLDPSKPIITMGGSASSGVAAAANAGGPAPTLLSTSRSVPRIILPDGTVKRVTPEMMRRLMGLPEIYPIPSNPKIAKEVLGNGVDGAFTRALIDPLLNRAETQPSAETPTQPLTFKEKAKEAKQKADEAAEEIKRLLKGRNGGLGISPFGRAKRLAEIDRAVVVALASYVRNKVLAGAYTFKDFVKDMKENSKRMFGVEIRVTAQDELFFNQSASMYEIDDAFAGEIMELKNDFITAIAAMSGRINMNFEEFVASNQSLVDQFMDSAETNYGLNPAQAEALVKAMYQDALRAAANRNQLYQTEADIKNYQENAILGNRAFQDVSNSNKAVEVARRSNSISRLYDGFLRAFVTPTLSFDRVFRLAKDRLSLEREVYASRKSRMGASTKAANWYSDVQKKIFGGLSWGQLERLNEYIIAKRILDVEEKRNQDVAYSIKLNEELADPATTDDRKAEINEELSKLGNLGEQDVAYSIKLQEELADPATTDDRKAEINEELAKLSNLGEIKHGSAMLNGKKVELTVDFAQGVIDANSGLDAKSIEIRERAEAYRKANDELLKMRLDAGLISQAAYDSMIKRDYVRRIFLDLSSSTIDAVDYPSISAKIKAIQEGSTDKSLEMDTQALLQLNAAATFDAVAKNKFIDKVAKWTENNQQAFLDRALEKFEKKFEKKNGKPLTDDEKQKFLKEQTLFEPIRNNQTPRSGFEKVTYFVDGVEKSMAVRSDLAAVFQTASGRGPVQNKQLISVMSKLNLTGLIKASAVFFNPAFALGNFALDVVHASMVTRDLYKSFSANLGVILAKALGITAENVYSKAVNYGGSLFGMAKRDSKFDRLVRDYFAHGGGMTFMSEIGSKMYTKRMAQSQLGKAKSVAVDNASKIISVFNSVQSGSELITRVIIYEAALEKNIKEYKKQNGVEPTGADLTFMKESAAASAADLIDFREGTNTTKGLDQTFMPFLNAMVQGARAEIDFIAKNPIVAATRLAEFGGMALAVALYNAKSGEDDEKNGIIGYNGVSEYIRANYFVMMMPWTKKNEKGEVVRPYVSIKLPAMLKSINIFVEGTVSSRGYGEVTSQMAEAIKGGYVPEIGAASPTTQAVFALTANKDFFRKGAKVYRGKEKVLLPERFNMGETKKIYRDLFGAAYGLMNEEGEDKGVLGFNEAGPAQWQTAIEKAISSNNPYYLGITSGYANVSGLYGEKNQKEVDALYDDKLSALNSLAMRVYRTPQSSVQNSNSKKKEELKFLEKQIGSWQQRNTNTINGVVSKELREISESGKKKGFLLDRFFDEKIFNYISDAELTKEVKKAGIKKLPENLDDIQEFIKDEQSRMSIQLVEEFNPNFIFRHPALKEYNLAKNSYVGFNEDLILDIEKEYDNAKDGESYLIALKFVAGDDYDEIVTQIGVNPIEKMRVDNILKTPSAFQYKTAYFRRTNVSSNEVSSESAINNLILLKHLLENE